MIYLLLYGFIALFFSFICSLLEASLLSITPSFIDTKINEGKKYAHRLKRFKENIDVPLAAILTLNTFANTLGAAGVGAQAQNIWGNKYLSVASSALTVAILIFSELIPKTLGANYWQRLANFTTTVLMILINSPLYPFILLSKAISRILNRNKKQDSLSRAEFQAVAERGIKEGLFENDEAKIIRNFIGLKGMYAKDIMTPRTMLTTTIESETIAELHERIDEINFSRIPVFKETIDDISGYILKNELLENIINGAGLNPLKSMKREIYIVYEQISIITLLSRFLEKNEHIALVVGEYGETSGVITMEDVIETILGTEIMDEADSIEDLQHYARLVWQARKEKANKSSS